MKKIYLITIIFMVIGISCSEDYLVKDPLDQVTDASLSYTANECKLYVNQFYTVFLSNIYRNSPYTADNGTDNLLNVYYDSNKDLVGLHVIPSSGEGWGTDEWGKIRSVNFLLDNYTQSQELADAEKFVGEARFFRAYFYFEQFLTKFGGVPWIETQLSTTSGELTAPRLKRNELADKILADLDWAIEKVPSYTEQEKGRISKEVVQLYKARVALHEGTWERYHAGTVFAGEGNPTQYLRIASDAANAVIESGLFSLDNVGEEDGYFKLFNQVSYSASKEVMLYKDYNRVLSLVKPLTEDLGLYGAQVGMTKWLVDSYLCTDGKPVNVSGLYQGDDNLLTVVKNRDPRLSQTMFVPGRARRIENGIDTTVVFTKPHINYSVDHERNVTGYELAKGSISDSKAHDDLYEGGSDIIFRYAEALLIYAEARAELNEITQADLDITINKLRDRVGMPHLTVGVGYSDPNGEFTAARGYEGPPVSNLLQEIRRERRVELACEGFRMNDLKRWRAHHLWNHDKLQGCKTAQFKDLTWLINYFTETGAPRAINGGYDYFMTETVAKWTPAFTEGVNFWTDDQGYLELYHDFIPSGHFSFDPNKSYLNPIPTQELLLNENLEQNPGWK